jgi:phosphohistidine swiveling domain-containing protein
MNLHLDNKISKDEFDLKYGHLRSGTYDITTDTYSKMDFKENGTTEIQPVPKNLNESLDKDIIKKALMSIDMDIDAEQFLLFLKTSYEQREFFKFEFTKTLSLAIEILAKIAEMAGFTRFDFAYLDVADIYSSIYYTNIYDLKEFWTTIINQRKEVYKFNSQIILPDVILDENSFNFIKIEEMRPNFITDKIISAQTVALSSNKKSDIEGKIILIESADPGFDWIFSKNIKGLITMYGGVASHMAIRCSEFGLPAAIGCGEKIYNDILNMKDITLDCKNGKISRKVLQKCVV